MEELGALLVLLVVLILFGQVVAIVALVIGAIWVVGWLISRLARPKEESRSSSDDNDSWKGGWA